MNIQQLTELEQDVRAVLKKHDFGFIEVNRFDSNTAGIEIEMGYKSIRKELMEELIQTANHHSVTFDFEVSANQGNSIQMMCLSNEGFLDDFMSVDQIVAIFTEVYPLEKMEAAFVQVLGDKSTQEVKWVDMFYEILQQK